MRCSPLAFTFLLAACGSAVSSTEPTTAPAASEVSTGAENERAPVRIAETRFALSPIDGLDVPNGGAPGFATADELVALVVLEIPAPYGASVVDEVLSSPASLAAAPRETIALEDGRAATLVRLDERQGRTLVLITGDEAASVAVMVVIDASRLARSAEIERALCGAAWLAPYEAPRRFLADLDQLCRAAAEVPEPAEGSWMAALLAEAADDVVDPQLAEVLRVLPSMPPDDRMPALVSLARAYGRPDYRCDALARVLAR